MQRQKVESLAPVGTGGIELNRVGRDDDDEELALAPKREPSTNFKGHFANMMPAGLRFVYVCEEQKQKLHQQSESKQVLQGDTYGKANALSE